MFYSHFFWLYSVYTKNIVITEYNYFIPIWADFSRLFLLQEDPRVWMFARPESFLQYCRECIRLDALVYILVLFDAYLLKYVIL